MPRELAIFPLPIVLFPGAVQPLHIFEPRYRRLLADCLAGDRRFGISYSANAAAEAPPSSGQIGCIAWIRDTLALADGRSNIITEGERRYALIDWVPSDLPYLVARVEEFDDERDVPGEAESVAADVRRDFLRLLAALAVLTDRSDTPPPLPPPDDPAALSFHIAATLDLDPETKVSLLGLRSAVSRLRRLATVLAPLAPEAERRAAVHGLARGNGKSGLRPEIERRSP